MPFRPPPPTPGNGKPWPACIHVEIPEVKFATKPWPGQGQCDMDTKHIADCRIAFPWVLAKTTSLKVGVHQKACSRLCSQTCLFLVRAVEGCVGSESDARMCSPAHICACTATHARHQQSHAPETHKHANACLKHDAVVTKKSKSREYPHLKGHLFTGQD